MDILQIVTLGMGIVLILCGFLSQNESFIIWMTRWRNSQMGVKTQITNQTIKAGKFNGVVLIVTGIILIGLILVVFN